ncbi:transcriptional regulator [Spirochaetia bacterium]|nr:transcriptional regulator [Spirochaetia bacterium]
MTSPVFLIENFRKHSYNANMSEYRDRSIDRYIGQRIQVRRNMLGVTQKQLADICGITFQQIQKYESGETRIAAGRLYQLGIALDAPVSFFFSGLAKQTPASDFVSIDHPTEHRLYSPDANDPLAKNESLEIIRLFWKLPTDEMRANVMNLLRSMNT